MSVSRGDSSRGVAVREEEELEDGDGGGQGWWASGGL